VTLAPYFPTVPVGPGFYVERHNEIDLTIKKCSDGFYCPLARAIDLPTFGNETTEALLCPASTVCTESSVVTPTVCFCNYTQCSYCPSGTSDEIPCPAGYYCVGSSSIKECKKTQYCPEGSTLPSACPAGYFCETPSTKSICPRGYFCPTGCVRPHPCGWLSLCGEGNASVQFNLLGFAFVFICLLIVMIVLQAIKYGRNKYNKKMDVKRHEQIVTEMRELVSNKENPTEKEMRTAYADQAMNQYYSGNTKLGVNISFRDLSLTISNEGKESKILSGVTGEINHSELTCVMGGSGSGKTTFITSLCGRAYYGTRGGTVSLNGKEDDLTNFKKLTGFVPQSDILLPTMTVEETIHFAAKTRLGNHKTNEEISRIVSSIISVLGLEEVKHSLIGDDKKRGISGGQKKRVNIAVELAAVPSVLFCKFEFSIFINQVQWMNLPLDLTPQLLRKLFQF